MTKKIPENSSNSISNDLDVGFDSRGLDYTVIARLKQSADFEAQMIANFNAKVNSDDHQLIVNEIHQDKNNSETGGPSGLEPTRYGDWERKGRCYDF